MVDETKYNVAEHFFRNDYHDRGMVKWQGFYLSDHTEDVEKYTETESMRRNQVQMPEMTRKAISENLFKSFKDGTCLQYQLNQKSENGIYSPIHTGTVQGYVESDIFIAGERICIDTIRWCTLVD